MTTEARISPEISPIRNGRLYIKELQPTLQRIRLTALNGLTGKKSEISFVPLLKRTHPIRKDEAVITYLFEGATDEEAFGFFKLDDLNEVYILGKGTLLESHTNGHLVSPFDCRPITHEYLEENSEWDMAFDRLTRKQIIPIAAHKVESITVEKLATPIKLPKTSQYLRLLSEAQRL